MNNFGKNLILWAVIVLVLAAMLNSFQGGMKGQNQSEEVAFSDFLNAAQEQEVSDITMEGNRVVGHYTDGRVFRTLAPSNTDLVSKLEGTSVRISVKPQSDGSPTIWSVLLSWFPMLLLIAVWIFFMRQMGGGGSKAMGFGKSKAKLLNEKTGRVTFNDVAGVEEAKEELVEIVDYLKDPQKYQRLGGKIPKGVLLVGPPGTGKTLIARAVAGEAGVPFFTISGSDFVEMFVGVGASRVRDMFEQGKKSAPCIIFIDEIDAVGRHRGAGLGGGNDEREQTLNQLLVEMDGFEGTEGVIIIAATNRPDVLDPALLRPGRFDRQVVVPNADIAGRTKILEVHMKKLPLASDVDARVIARGTPGFSGADLANLVNEAALMAARRNRRVVSMKDFEEAKDKVMMGAERRSMAMTDEQKKLTAYHEAGHAICAINEPASDPIHKATIIPRGRALGMVMRLPEQDRTSMSREKLYADLCVAMGGRVAEEMIFGYDKVTTGASSDIQMATDMARKMVTEWGLSDKAGPLRYSSNQEEVFLGHSVAQQQNMSEATANMVDSEVRSIVEGSYERAKKLLKKHGKDLEKLAQGLLEYETLSGDDIKVLLAGKKLDRESDMPKASNDHAGSVPTVGSVSDTPVEEKPKAKPKKKATPRKKKDDS